MIRWLAPLFLGTGLNLSAPATEPASAPPPLLTTNEIRVANALVVTVTNYVVVTNTIVVTNDSTTPPLHHPVTPSPRDTNAPTAALPPLDWRPPEDTFDWIQLRSGEWLKGRIKAMQKRELEFDSKELDVLTFDWRDIRQLRSPRTMDVLFVTGGQLSGPVSVTPTDVLVGGATPQRFSRDDLQSLTPGGAREIHRWSGSISVGLALRSGNTEQLDYTGQASLQRRTPATRFRLDYLGNFSSIEGVANANNHRVTPGFDVWLSRRFYLVVPWVEYYRDSFQNIAHRVTASVGIGYDIIDHAKVEWSITTGPAYQYTWHDSAQAGESKEEGAAALVFGSRFEWDITRRIELSLEYRGQYTRREVGETIHHAVAALSIDITRRLDLDVSLVWDRINNPKVGADGVQPKPDDFRLMMGLGVDF